MLRFLAQSLIRAHVGINQRMYKWCGSKWISVSLPLLLKINFKKDPERDTKIYEASRAVLEAVGVISLSCTSSFYFTHQSHGHQADPKILESRFWVLFFSVDQAARALGQECGSTQAQHSSSPLPFLCENKKDLPLLWGR